MKFIKYEYRLPGWVLSYLINDDATGLEEGEQETADAFFKSVAEKWGGGHWSVDTETGKVDDFGRNDIDRFVGDVWEGVYLVAKKERPIDKILCQVPTMFGAPMGRNSVGKRPTDKHVFDCQVPVNLGGYDRGGAYWGHGRQLRVSYTRDLSFIHFYRVGQ